jgi:hypothetical protein
MKSEKYTIAWKIIKTHRRSGFIDCFLEKFIIKYPLLTLVKVPRLGCFCFKTKKQAKKYLGSSPERIIVKVLGIGEPVQLPEKIAFSDNLDLFYNDENENENEIDHYGEGLSVQTPPKGTICFRSIIPLE